MREAIIAWEKLAKKVSGKEAFIVKKALIEMRKNQYLIKNMFRKPIVPTKLVRSKVSIPLNDNTCEFDADGYPIPAGVSLLDPKVVSAILCNYCKLKEDSWDKFESDTWALMKDFDDVADIALKKYPIYEKIVECKIDGKSN